MTKVECQDLFQVAKWGCNSTNAFMRTVYCGRLWLTRTEAENAVYNGWNMADTFILIRNGNFGSFVLESQPAISGFFVHHIMLFLSAQEAFGCCSAISARNGWALYYVRPKIHMFCHLLPLGSRVSVGCTQFTFKFPPCVRLLRLQMAYVLEQPSAECILNPASQALSIPGLMCAMCMSHVHSARYVCVCVRGVQCSKAVHAGATKTTLDVSVE